LPSSYSLVMVFSVDESVQLPDPRAVTGTQLQHLLGIA